MNCAPSSGSRFSIGNTEVRCVATDDAGNASQASFNVNVLGAPEQIVAVLELIRRMPLRDSMKSRLIGFLQEALADPRNNLIVCRVLRALISFAQIQPSSALAPELRAQIVADATRIRAVLGCPSR